jgi:DNA polymerase-3 subunit alpha
MEKEVLGLYLSDHPLRGYEGSLRRLATATTADIESLESGSLATFAGIISKIERKMTKKGDPMAVVQLEDLHGGVELTVFARTLQQHSHKLHDDAIVAVKCRVNRNDDRLSISALEVMPAVLTSTEPELRLDFPAVALDPDTVSRLKDILVEHPGAAPVYLHVGDSKVLRLGDDFNVDVDRVIPPLRVAFGSGVIR